MSEVPSSVPPASQSTPLFREKGASWYWLLAGPGAAASMLYIEQHSGYGMQLLLPVTFLVLVSGFLGVQVKAARIHTSVELTPDTLRQGLETVQTSDIVFVYPRPERRNGRSEKPEKWQKARALGELSGVPRGRVGIGLRLAGGRTVQAWARHHRTLRSLLASLVEQRSGVVEENIGFDADFDIDETTDEATGDTDDEESPW